jgi:hypothetical protein
MSRTFRKKSMQKRDIINNFIDDWYDPAKTTEQDIPAESKERRTAKFFSDQCIYHSGLKKSLSKKISKRMNRSKVKHQMTNVFKTDELENVDIIHPEKNETLKGLWRRCSWG